MIEVNSVPSPIETQQPRQNTQAEKVQDLNQTKQQQEAVAPDVVVNISSEAQDRLAATTETNQSNSSTDTDPVPEAQQSGSTPAEQQASDNEQGLRALE